MNGRDEPMVPGPPEDHEFGAQRLPLRLLGRGVGKVAPNFLKALFSLLIPLKTFGLLQRGLEGIERQILIAEESNAFDRFHHRLISEDRKVLGIDLG